MAHIYTLGAFCALQCLFHFAHQWYEGHEERLRKARIGGVILILTHPLVISGTHDWAIYLVGEMHAIFSH